MELTDEGMTMICASHEMGLVRSFADGLVFIKFGEIVESNEPEEFFNNHQSDRSKLFLRQILSPE